MTQHILGLSYGKDSLACLGAIEQLGWPLDRIVHTEVWATDTIPADLPPMVDFKAKADEIIKRRWGIEVEHVCRMKNGQKLTFERQFYTMRKSSVFGPVLYGWPCLKHGWCVGELKIKPQKQLRTGDDVQYLGIAADEPERIKRLKGDLKSPLAAVGWTEADCMRWCEANDLVSPIYRESTRGGCWFCHNQSVESLRTLRRKYPDYWALMFKWDADSPVTFKPGGRALRDYDKRFAMEEEGRVQMGHKFRWADVIAPKQLPGQIGIEEVLGNETAGIHRS